MFFGQDQIFSVLYQIANKPRICRFPDSPQWPVWTARNLESDRFRVGERFHGGTEKFGHDCAQKNLCKKLNVKKTIKKIPYGPEGNRVGTLCAALSSSTNINLVRRMRYYKIWCSALRCTDFITQHGCWVLHFRLTKMVRRKWSVPIRYQLSKGKLAGFVLQYFYMIHRVGRMAYSGT